MPPSTGLVQVQILHPFAGEVCSLGFRHEPRGVVVEAFYCVCKPQAEESVLFAREQPHQECRVRAVPLMQRDAVAVL